MNPTNHWKCFQPKLFFTNCQNKISLKLTNFHLFSRSRSTRESLLLHHLSVHSDSCHLSQVRRNGTLFFFGKIDLHISTLLLFWSIWTFESNNHIFVAWQHLCNLWQVKIWLLKSIFNVKNHVNLSENDFFPLKIVV